MGVRIPQKAKEMVEKLEAKRREFTDLKLELLNSYLDNVIFEEPSIYEGYIYTAIKDKIIAVGFTEEAVSDNKIKVPPVFDGIDFTDFAKGTSCLTSQITEIDFGMIQTIATGVLDGFSGLKRVSGYGMLQLGEKALANKFMLETVDFPNLALIGTFAFNKSTIREIDLPNVVYIDDYAFSDTLELNEVKLASYTGFSTNGKPSIGVFSQSGIKKLDVPNITVLGDSFLSSCSNLKALKVLRVRALGAGALEGCEGLIALYVGNLVALAENSLGFCSSLEYIYTTQTLAEFRHADTGWKIQGETELEVIKNIIDAGHMVFEYKDENENEND